MGKLTARRAATAPAGKWEDGDGLRLVVSDAGSRSWVLRLTIEGKRRELGLGSFKLLGLADARAKAAAIRAKVAAGDPDPTAKVEVAKVMNFTMAAAAYVRAHRAKWSSKRHGRIWVRSLANYAKPVLGSLPVGEIGVEDVLRTLTPVWTKIPVTAARIRERVEAVLDYATVRKWRAGDNPARWKGNLVYVLPAPGDIATVEHHPAVPYADLPRLMTDLEQAPELAAQALRFTILTACRTGEALGATWAEIDLEGRVWVIPASRMKARHEHAVPLSGAAVAILEALPRVDEWVFPGRKYGEHLNRGTMVKALRRAGYGPGGARGPGVPHGMRASFSTWAAETQPFPRELVEEALAHATGNATERAYRRTVLLERRRPLMAAWADWCCGSG